MKNSRIFGRIFNKPLMVSQTYLDTVVQFMDYRMAGESGDLNYEGAKPHKTVSFCAMDGDESVSSDAVIETSKNIAIVPVMGALVQRGGQLDAESNVLRGYNEIKNDIYVSLQNEDVGGVMLMIDSPGGDVSGNFDLSKWISQISSQTDKPIWSLASESAYSAAYSIASAGERLISTRSAGVGSIGVVVAHANYERAAEMAGIDVTFIHSGRHKVDGNAYEALSQETINRIQSELDFHYSDFVSLVANNRGISEQAVRDTEALTYNSEDALRLSLIDSVMTEDDAIAEMIQYVNQTGSSAATTTQGNSMTETKTYSEADLQASVNEAVQANDEKWTALLSHEKAGNTAAVIKIAGMGLDSEQSASMMDLVAAPQASVVVEVTPDAKEKDAKPAANTVAAQLAAFLNSSEVNSVNTNASTDDDKQEKPKAVDPQAELKRLKSEGELA